MTKRNIIRLTTLPCFVLGGCAVLAAGRFLTFSQLSACISLACFVFASALLLNALRSDSSRRLFLQPYDDGARHFPRPSVLKAQLLVSAGIYCAAFSILLGASSDSSL